jgi:hypothetical protein
VGGTLGGVILIILLLLAFWWYRRHHRTAGPPLAEVEELPPGYSRRSELHPNATSVAYQPVAQVKPELAAVPVVSRVESPAAEAERPRTPRHEMDNGIGANMNSGPLYEMPAHGNWN